jgi:hypothetical protein
MTLEGWVFKKVGLCYNDKYEFRSVDLDSFSSHSFYESAIGDHDI